MVTSPEGDGAILLGTGCHLYEYNIYSFNSIFFQLKANPNGTFEWIILNQRLSSQPHIRRSPNIDYIDDSEVSCQPKPTPTPTSTTTTTINTGPPKLGNV